MRNLLHQAEELRGGCLVDTRLLRQPQQPDCLEQPQSAYAVGIGGIFGCIEAHLDMAHCREVVYLIGLHLLHDAREVHRVGHIAVVQYEIALLQVRILVDMVYSLGVKHRCTTLYAVYRVSLFQEVFAQVCAVLPGHAGDQCYF